MSKLKIGLIGLGQRGAAYGMADGSIGLLGNILNNSDVLVTALCDSREERINFAAEKVIAEFLDIPVQKLWPLRFNADGSRKSSRLSKYTGIRIFRQRQKSKAA